MNTYWRVFLIYCLDKTDDGSYVAMNRFYKPIGTMDTTRYVLHEDFPSRFKFKPTLSERQIANLSFNRDKNAQRIYFYNDGCPPYTHWKDYEKRLKILSNYELVPFLRE